MKQRSVYILSFGVPNNTVKKVSRAGIIIRFSSRINSHAGKVSDLPKTTPLGHDRAVAQNIALILVLTAVSKYRRLLINNRFISYSSGD